MDLEKKRPCWEKKETPFAFYAFHGRSENELSHKFRHKSVGNSLEIWTRPNENHSNSQEESNDELKTNSFLWSKKRNGVCWVPHIIEPDKSFSHFFSHGGKIRRKSAAGKCENSPSTRNRETGPGSKFAEWESGFESFFPPPQFFMASGPKTINGHVTAYYFAPFRQNWTLHVFPVWTRGYEWETNVREIPGKNLLYSPSMSI